jgi:hypothetical protein
MGKDLPLKFAIASEYFLRRYRRQGLSLVLIKTGETYEIKVVDREGKLVRMLGEDLTQEQAEAVADAIKELMAISGFHY